MNEEHQLCKRFGPLKEVQKRANLGLILLIYHPGCYGIAKPVSNGHLNR